MTCTLPYLVVTRNALPTNNGRFQVQEYCPRNMLAVAALREKCREAFVGPRRCVGPNGSILKETLNTKRKGRIYKSIYLPMTVGSRSRKIARGTYLPLPVSVKNDAKPLSSPRPDLSGILPSFKENKRRRGFHGENSEWDENKLKCSSIKFFYQIVLIDLTQCRKIIAYSLANLF